MSTSEEARQTEQAAKQAAEQQRHAEEERLRREAADDVAHLQQGEPAKRPPWSAPGC